MSRAALLPIILTVLCSLPLCSGCAGRSEASTPLAPFAVAATPCPAPTAPNLPAVDGAMSFDHPANVEILLTRDARLRRYVHGLRDALACYQAQAAPVAGQGEQ